MPKKPAQSPTPKQEQATDAPPEHIPDDSEMLVELLEDMDTFGAMLDRAGQAVKQGRPDVRLIPRGKVRPVGEALDELGLAMTRRTMQVRAQRALRDGAPDDTLREVLDELAPDNEPE